MKKSILTMLVLMVTCLVTVFSLGIFQSVMNLRDRGEASGEYKYYIDSSLAGAEGRYNFSSNACYINLNMFNLSDLTYGDFYINSQTGFLDFMDSYKTFYGRTIHLETDIACPYEVPCKTQFSGTFNGWGHTISLCRFTAINGHNSDGDGTTLESVQIGMFEELRDSAVVKNLRLYGCSYMHKTYWIEEKVWPIYVGGIAGYMGGSAWIDNCMIESCAFYRSTFFVNQEGEVIDDKINRGVYVGGVVGKTSDGNTRISNVHVQNFDCNQNDYGDVTYCTIGPATLGGIGKGTAHITSSYVADGTKADIATSELHNLNEDYTKGGNEFLFIRGNNYIRNNKVFTVGGKHVNKIDNLDFDDENDLSQPTWSTYKNTYGQEVPYLTMFAPTSAYTIKTSDSRLGYIQPLQGTPATPIVDGYIVELPEYGVLSAYPNFPYIEKGEFGVKAAPCSGFDFDRWEVSDDGKTYTAYFKIKPVSTTIWSWARFMDDASNNAYAVVRDMGGKDVTDDINIASGSSYIEIKMTNGARVSYVGTKDEFGYKMYIVSVKVNDIYIDVYNVYYPLFGNWEIVSSGMPNNDNSPVNFTDVPNNNGSYIVTTETFSPRFTYNQPPPEEGDNEYSLFDINTCCEDTDELEYYAPKTIWSDGRESVWTEIYTDVYIDKDTSISIEYESDTSGEYYTKITIYVDGYCTAYLDSEEARAQLGVPVLFTRIRTTNLTSTGTNSYKHAAGYTTCGIDVYYTACEYNAITFKPIDDAYLYKRYKDDNRNWIDDSKWITSTSTYDILKMKNYSTQDIVEYVGNGTFILYANITTVNGFKMLTYTAGDVEDGNIVESYELVSYLFKYSDIVVDMDIEANHGTSESVYGWFHDDIEIQPSITDGPGDITFTNSREQVSAKCQVGDAETTTNDTTVKSHLTGKVCLINTTGVMFYEMGDISVYTNEELTEVTFDYTITTAKYGEIDSPEDGYNYTDGDYEIVYSIKDDYIDKYKFIERSYSSDQETFNIVAGLKQSIETSVYTIWYIDLEVEGPVYYKISFKNTINGWDYKYIYPTLYKGNMEEKLEAYTLDGTHFSCEYNYTSMQDEYKLKIALGEYLDISEYHLIDNETGTNKYVFTFLVGNIETHETVTYTVVYDLGSLTDNELYTLKYGFSENWSVSDWNYFSTDSCQIGLGPGVYNLVIDWEGRQYEIE